MGSIKSVSLRDLLTKYPVCNEKEQVRNVAQMLLETSNWWLDIFAASDEEMRALSKVCLDISILQNAIAEQFALPDFSNSSSYDGRHPDARIA